MKHIIPIRVYLIAQTFAGIAAAIFAEDERVYALLRTGGIIAEIVVGLTALLAFVAGADIFLSERRWRIWSAVRAKRARVWIALGAALAVQAGVAYIYGFMPWVVIRDYGLPCLGCLAVACIDIHYLEKEACQRKSLSAAAAFDDKPIERTSWPA